MYMTELPDFELFKHRIPVQLRFNDIDILGHVNNTKYFSFYDTGKALFLEKMEKGPKNWNEVRYVIANVDCAFIKSIYFGEKIEVFTRCKSIGEKSLVLEQMLVNPDKREVKSVCHSVMVYFDRETHKGCPLPAELIARFRADDPNIEMLPGKH